MTNNSEVVVSQHLCGGWFSNLSRKNARPFREKTPKFQWTLTCFDARIICPRRSYSSELGLRDWGGHLSDPLDPFVLDLKRKRTLTQNGRRKQRDWWRYTRTLDNQNAPRNHCDFQTPIPPTPGRTQLAIDNYCEGNVAHCAMNDRTEPFLRCSDLRVISGCRLGREATDNRKYVCDLRFAPLFIARLIFWPMRSSQRNRVAREVQVSRNCAKKSVGFEE